MKLDPQADGKGRGTGKSRVITEEVYLGTADDVLRKCQANPEPQSIQQKSFAIECAPLAIGGKRPNPNTVHLRIRMLFLISSHVDLLKWKLATFWVLSLLFTWTLGFLLSQSFLQPIAYLTLGLRQ